MSELFNNMHHLKMVEGNQIFLDRDPEAFNNVLRYLRTNRKFLPSDSDQNLRKLVELEIKYWEVNKGLSSSLIESDLQRKIEDLLVACLEVLGPDFSFATALPQFHEFFILVGIVGLLGLGL